jgi:hypothetical protein
MDGSIGFPPLYLTSMELMDHRFSNLHLGAKVEVGERTPQNLGKNLFDLDPEQG